MTHGERTSTLAALLLVTVCAAVAAPPQEDRHAAPKTAVSAPPPPPPPLAEPKTTASHHVVPFADLVPMFSHAKALVHLLSGETAAARRTFGNYNSYGLGASQMRALGHLLIGEPDKVVEEQARFANAFLDTLDAVPLVGHVKALVHSLTGDAKRATKAMLMATSALGAVLGGAIAGPEGMKAGQTLMDSVISLANATMNAN